MASTPKSTVERGAAIEKGASVQASSSAASSTAGQQVAQQRQAPVGTGKPKGKNNMYRSLFKKKGPSKGRVEAVIKGRHMNDPDTRSQLDVLLKGKDFHAPLVERVFDMPIDINKGILHIRILSPEVLHSRH